MQAMSRRQAVQVGVFGAMGLSMADLFRIQAKGEETQTQAFTAASGGTTQLPQKALSVIQLHLGGGMPQHESFDPKPEAPVEYRGTFGVTKRIMAICLAITFRRQHPSRTKSQ